MSLFKFRIWWSEDDTTFRDIEILSASTYFDFHEIIKKEFQLPADMQACIYLSDDLHKRGRALSSAVEKNLRDAPALSMKRTPLGALISDPHQKFIYTCEHPKGWIFFAELISLLPEPAHPEIYPRCTKTEGLSPSQVGVIPSKKDSVMELEERYDLNGQEEGYGDEGEEEQSEEGTEEESGFFSEEE